MDAAIDYTCWLACFACPSSIIVISVMGSAIILDLAWLRRSNPITAAVKFANSTWWVVYCQNNQMLNTGAGFLMEGRRSLKRKAITPADEKSQMKKRSGKITAHLIRKDSTCLSKQTQIWHNATHSVRQNYARIRLPSRKTEVRDVFGGHDAVVRLICNASICLSVDNAILNQCPHP